MSNVRTVEEINEEYTEVCKQIGDLTVKELALKAAKDVLLAKVNVLNQEVTQAVDRLPKIPTDQEINDKLKAVETK